MSKFDDFANLHVGGEPLVLFNAWDAGSATAVAKSGAKAIATGSASVAMANGFGDGEEVPLEFAIGNAERIVKAVELPVTVDFEGGYATDANGLTANGRRLAATGAIGCNFEDQIVGTDRLYDIAEQAARRGRLFHSRARRTKTGRGDSAGGRHSGERDAFARRPKPRRLGQRRDCPRQPRPLPVHGDANVARGRGAGGARLSAPRPPARSRAGLEHRLAEHAGAELENQRDPQQLPGNRREVRPDAGLLGGTGDHCQRRR